jgi:hypothetical protein
MNVMINYAKCNNDATVFVSVVSPFQEDISFDSNDIKLFQLTPTTSNSFRAINKTTVALYQQYTRG